MEARVRIPKQKTVKGGKRAGAGRKKGSLNGMSREMREAAKETGDLPHMFQLKVSQSEVGDVIKGHTITWEDIQWASSACSSKFAPNLASTTHSGVIETFNLPAEALKGLSNDELASLERVFGRLHTRTNGHSAAAAVARREDEDEGTYDPNG